MSELIHVINLTKFLAFSTGPLKPVDNPAHYCGPSLGGAELAAPPFT
jgi:hypothetical protein